MTSRKLILSALCIVLAQVYCCTENASAQGFFHRLKDAVQDTVRGTLDVTKDAVDATVDTVDEITDSPSSVPRYSSQPSTSTGHYPAQITSDVANLSAYADAQVPIPEFKSSPAGFKFAGHDSEPGEKNIPLMGSSVPVPIPDRVTAAIAPGAPPVQEEFGVPKALAAQISQQFHGASAVIGGKRKNGFPIAGETYLKINGQEYRFRPDGSWCNGCTSNTAEGIKPGAQILTGGRFYRLNPTSSKWQLI